MGFSIFRGERVGFKVSVYGSVGGFVLFGLLIIIGVRSRGRRDS